MLSCLVYFYITYLILSCTFIYILILFIYCSFICLLSVSSLFHVVSHVSILCLWHMLYLYFSYIHIHTCTIAYIHILSSTLCFRILSLLFLCSYTYFHIKLYCTSCSCNCLYFHRIAIGLVTSQATRARLGLGSKKARHMLSS